MVHNLLCCGEENRILNTEEVLRKLVVQGKYKEEARPRHELSQERFLANFGSSDPPWEDGD
jgi:hypothetical protein